MIAVRPRWCGVVTANTYTANSIAHYNLSIYIKKYIKEGKKKRPLGIDACYCLY